MARDPSTGPGATVAAQPKPQARPQDFSAVTAVAPKPDALPTGPPHPTLMASGFNGSIHDFNDRVQHATDAYQQAYGVKPTPGLLFDVVRSPLGADQFQTLFTVPQSARQAKAQQAIDLHRQQGGLVATDVTSIAKGIMAAAEQGNFDAFLKDNDQLISGLAKNPKIQAAMFNARRYLANHEVDVKVNSGEMSPLEGQQRLRQMGFLPGGAAYKAPKGVFGEAAIGIGQVAESLVHAPGGLYQAGKAVTLDADDLVHGDFTPERTARIVKAMGEQVAADFRHPLQNPGYLFLDVLGLVSLGAGTAARLGAAGRVLRVGEGVGAAVKAAATKPETGTFRIGRAGAEENVVLSSNPAVAAVQRVVLSSRQRALDLATLEGEAAPGPLRSILIPSGAQDWLDEHFSFATKVGREANARRRVEHEVALTLPRELDHVAGTSRIVPRVYGRLPEPVRNGLTRGEQKAIWVAATDDLNPLQTNIDFHRRMIDLGIGDPKAHRRQLADLGLARKALEDPSPRLVKALALTRQVVGEMERRKIDELGLTPEVAEGRVAKLGTVLRGEDLVKGPSGEPLVREPGTESYYALERDLNQSQTVLRGEQRKLTTLERRLARPTQSGKKVPRPKLEARVRRQRASVAEWSGKVQEAQGRFAAEGPQVTPLERVTPESFYLPAQPRGKAKRPPSDRLGFYATKPGPFGIPLPRDLPELRHEFTGKAIQAGDFRVDATSLATEAYARTVRAATVLNEHQRLWKVATETPRSRFDVPIRDSQKISDDLRAAMNDIADGAISQADAESLPKDVRTLIEELYPDRDAVLKEPIEGVRWIDGRILGSAAEIPTRPGALVKAMEAINTPVRAVTLFLRPAYLLNALGNTAMLVFHQGFAAVPAMARSLVAHETLGEDTVRTIDALMGSGRSRSYVSGITGKTSQKLAGAWNVITDQAFRRASFLYEAKVKGYTTPEQLQALVRESSPDLVEIKRRANKALVEFDNLTEFEKNTLRHIIFVYPWVSRSAVYSLRAIMEHPVRVGILTQLGRLEEDSDPLFHRVPDWFKQVGYFPIGWNANGTPKVVNPTSVNTLSTLGELVNVAGAGLGGTKYASFSDLFGPVPSFFLHGAFGMDEFGNKYPDRQWLRAAADVLGGLPQVSAFERGGKPDPALKPVDVTQRDSLRARLNSALRRTVFSPGWLDGYGSLLAGGLAPRGMDPDAAEARFWRDQTPEQRHELETGLLDQALGMQAEFLKQPVPQTVRDAVKAGSDISFRFTDFQHKNGRPPTPKERAQMTIGYLAETGKVTPDEQKQLERLLRPLGDEGDINTFRARVFTKYGDGRDLAEWDQDVRLVASFKKETFSRKTADLKSQGLISGAPDVSQERLFDYGRQYLAFNHQVDQLKEEIKAGRATMADLRAFQDQHDKPVNGLPSFPRTAWAYLPKEQQQQAVVSAATSSWSALTAVEKEILGRPSDPRVTAGWAKLQEVVASQRAELARQGQSFPSGYRRILARYVERNFDAPGLVKDFDFAQQPLYARMQRLKPVQDSPHADLWSQLLSTAQGYGRYLKADGYDKAQVRQGWRDYVRETLAPWVAEHPAFKAELGQYGRTLLNRLLS